MKQREIWIDYLRGFACILVTLGHMLMGLQDQIISSQLITFCIDFIYHFHVYLFFFCSGYLLQKSFSDSNHSRNFFYKKLYRCFDFITLYILFSAITFFVKIVLSGDVNTPVEHSFLQTLLNHPINQMWYLYAIAVITLCTPMVQNEHGLKFVTSVAILLKVMFYALALNDNLYLPFRFLFENEIWYVLGIICAYKHVLPTKRTALVAALAFIATDIAIYFCDINNELINTILTFSGIIASTGFFVWFASKKNKTPLGWELLAKYMLPIYLLHTIFAAGIRIILIRFGIMSVWIHLVMGLLFSFGGPIICGVIAERIRILNVFFYPSKTIKSFINQRNSNTIGNTP